MHIKTRFEKDEPTAHRETYYVTTLALPAYSALRREDRDYFYKGILRVDIVGIAASLRLVIGTLSVVF